MMNGMWDFGSMVVKPLLRSLSCRQLTIPSWNMGVVTYRPCCKLQGRGVRGVTPSLSPFSPVSRPIQKSVCTARRTGLLFCLVFAGLLFYPSMSEFLGERQTSRHGPSHSCPCLVPVDRYIALEGEGFMEMRVKHLVKVGELHKATVLAKVCADCCHLSNGATFRQIYVAHLCGMLPSEEAIVEVGVPVLFAWSCCSACLVDGLGI